MRRYTTPTKAFRVKGLDLTPYDVELSLRQRIGRSLNAHEVDIGMDGLTVRRDGTDTLVTATLTQGQTGGFVAGTVDVQINYGRGTSRNATVVGTVQMEPNILTREVEFSSGSATFSDDDAVELTVESDIPAGGVGTDELADGAVTPAKLDRAYVEASSITHLTTAQVLAYYE